MSRVWWLRILKSLPVVALIAAAVGMHFWGAQWGPSLFVEHMQPGFIRDESWRRSIANDPTAHGYSAYGVLQDRLSRAAVAEAHRDLNSADAYVWFNAALYLGALGEPAAIPYLIEGLQHNASRAHAEVAGQLQSMTGESFGVNYGAWKTWWEAQQPAPLPDEKAEAYP